MHLQSGFMEYSIIWMKRKQSIHQCHPFSNEEDDSPYMISTQATNPINRSAGPYFCSLGPGPVMSWWATTVYEGLLVGPVGIPHLTDILSTETCWKHVPYLFPTLAALWGSCTDG